MNQDMLKEAGIDYDDGLRRFMGRTALYESLLLSFTEDDTFESVSSAYEAKNLPELLENAHELKGMSGNLSLTPLYKAASDLVTLLRGQEFSDRDLSDAYLLTVSEYIIIKEAVIAAAQA